VTRVVDLIRAGRATEARDLQAAQAAPLADRLERLTNQLVNKAEADMIAGIEASTQAYANAQWVVIAFALASIVALGLGYAISWSVIGPVKKIEARLDLLSAGDSTQRVHVANRDPAPLSKTPAISRFSRRARSRFTFCVKRREIAARLGRMGRRDGGPTLRLVLEMR